MSTDKPAEPFEYSLEVQTHQFTMKSPEGYSVACEIRELTGSQRDSYLNSVSKRTKVVDGVPRISNFEGMHSDLLSRCTYRVGEEKPITAAEIQMWPARIQESLFRLARKLSALGKEQGEDDNEGND